MQTINIHTWKCAACDYQQDFDPTTENMALNFKKEGVQENECPSCVSQGLRGVVLPKETVAERKSKMNIFEAGDIEAKRQVLLSEGPNKLGTSFKEVRVETEEEKVDRVSKKGGPDKLLQREFQIMRIETAEEQTERVENKLAGMKENTPEEIQALKDKYEDA